MIKKISNRRKGKESSKKVVKINPSLVKANLKHQRKVEKVMEIIIQEERVRIRRKFSVTTVIYLETMLMSVGMGKECLVLDSGCSNHMIGHNKLLREINKNVK